MGVGFQLSSRFPRILTLAVAVAAGLLPAGVQGAEFHPDPAIDDIMYRLPEFPPLPDLRILLPRTIPVWMEAMQRPEDELQRLAADAVVAATQLNEVPDLSLFLPELRRLLSDESTARLTRIAVARALIRLDVRDAADELLAWATRDGDALAQIVEPALGRWKHAGVQRVWRARLTVPHPTRTALIMALEGLEQLQATAAADDVQRLVESRTLPPDLRLAAARTLGTLRAEGLLSLAVTLEGDRQMGPLRRELLAAHVLARHRDEASVAKLQQMATGYAPAAAAVAVTGMLETNPENVVAVHERLLASRDAKLRRLGAESLFRKPTAERMEILATVLSDRHAGVRRSVRKWMVELAGHEELDTPVREAAIQVLYQDDWRGQEQAALLCGRLDQESVAERLIELLDHDRYEVSAAAAWALRELQVPETLPAILSRAEQNGVDRTRFTPGLQEEQEQLFQALGLMRYRPASAMLQTYIPLSSSGPRAAAIWALGRIHQGEAPKGLVRRLMGRVNDLDQEIISVREFAAIAIGEMKGRQVLDDLRTYVPKSIVKTRTGQACGWAIHRITGEPMPESVSVDYFSGPWFLEPLLFDLDELDRDR